MKSQELSPPKIGGTPRTSHPSEHSQTLSFRAPSLLFVAFSDTWLPKLREAVIWRGEAAFVSIGTNEKNFRLRREKSTALRIPAPRSLP
jgi:hypothetical protein